MEAYHVEFMDSTVHLHETTSLILAWIRCRGQGCSQLYRNMQRQRSWPGVPSNDQHWNAAACSLLGFPKALPRNLSAPLACCDGVPDAVLSMHLFPCGSMTDNDQTLAGSSLNSMCIAQLHWPAEDSLTPRPCVCSAELQVHQHQIAMTKLDFVYRMMTLATEGRRLCPGLLNPRDRHQIKSPLLNSHGTVFMSFDSCKLDSSLSKTVQKQRPNKTAGWQNTSRARHGLAQHHIVSDSI